MLLSSEQLTLSVAARRSPLSRLQVEELYNELRRYHGGITFAPEFVTTTGDRDQKSSLRGLEKSDFFTAEIDRMVKNGQCRIAIHSAKDLPAPLPEGLSLIALTKGLDPSDALVLCEEQTIDSLSSGALIATSSERREAMVKQLRSDLAFIDLRGTIGKRLEKLHNGEASGVVIAEAALIRLKLTHLNRVILPGKTAEGQGQLAVVARSDDLQMKRLFSSIDSRQFLA